MSINSHDQQPLRMLGFLVIGLLVLSGCKGNSDQATNQNLPPSTSQPVRVSSQNADAAEPAIATSPDGSVYIVWVNHSQAKQSDVMIARFTGDGHMQGAAVRVNSQPGVATAWRGDPPTVAVAPDHTIFVGWTARVESESGHATNLYLSSSRDQGQTFSAPVRVNDDLKPATHGMHSLAVGNDGRVYVAWLDERNIVPMKDKKMGAKTAGHHMESNRDVFFSSSTDGGRTFTLNQQIASDVCPCCKTALASGPEGSVYLSWRQVLPGDFRHIAVASSADGGKTFNKPVIVSDDQWMIKGCPVSGATLVAGTDGRLRVLWYAGGENTQQGIYWSESQDGGRTFSPRELVASGFIQGTPGLVADRLNIPFAIWESSSGGTSEVHASHLSKATELPRHLIVGGGELPVAVAQNQHVLIAYVAKDGDKQAVWMKTIGRFAREG
ncbi:MAG: glycoside hydrolase [Pyrinomonadaceae bacterium]|nr:glycoside hydrolase [Pyrinomonadaceae bacterium]